MNAIYIFAVMGSFFLAAPLVLEAKNFTENQSILKSKVRSGEQFILDSDHLEDSSPKNPNASDSCIRFFDPNCK
jgi:hypothetical protein